MTIKTQCKVVVTKHDLVNNTTTFKTLAKDPANNLKLKNNQIVSDRVKHNYIDKITSMKLKINSTLPPKFYGLPKVHKTGTPLWPIVASLKLATYTL